MGQSQSSPTPVSDVVKAIKRVLTPSQPKNTRRKARKRTEPNSDLCTDLRQESNRYSNDIINLRKNREVLITERNMLKKDRNSLRRELKGYKNEIKDIEDSIQKFPRQRSPLGVNLLMDNLHNNEGLNNIKFENAQQNHIYTQKFIKKHKDKKIRLLKEKRASLDSDISVSNRLLVYYSNYTILKQSIYRVLILVSILLFIVFMVKYLRGI